MSMSMITILGILLIVVFLVVIVIEEYRDHDNDYPF